MNQLSKQLLTGTAALLTLSSAAFASATWTTVGTDISDGFSGGKHTVTIAADNAPCIAYRVMKKAPTGPGAPDWAPQVVKYDSDAGTWNVLDSASLSQYDGSSNFPEVITGDDGELYLSVINIYNNYKASVLKYNGASWEPVGNEGFTEELLSQVPKIAVAEDGTAYATYRINNNKTQVVQKCVNGTWEQIGIVDVVDAVTAEGVGHLEPSIIIGNDGAPIVTFRTHLYSPMVYGNYSHVIASRYDEATQSWGSIDNVNFIAEWDGGLYDTMRDITLGKDADGTIYAAYLDSRHLNTVFVKKCEVGGDWELVGTEITDDQFSEGYRAIQIPVNLDLDIAADGTPYVTLKLTVTANHAHSAPIEKDVVMKFDGAAWHVLGYEPEYSSYMESYSNSAGTIFTDVEVASNGTVYASYQDGMTEAVKVKTFDNGYTEWAVGISYEFGQLVTYEGKLWECKYTHTSNIAWTPGTEGLWFWEEVIQ